MCLVAFRFSQVHKCRRAPALRPSETADIFDQFMVCVPPQTSRSVESRLRKHPPYQQALSETDSAGPAFSADPAIFYVNRGMPRR